MSGRNGSRPRPRRRHLDERCFDDIGALPPPGENTAGLPANRTDVDEHVIHSRCRAALGMIAVDQQAIGQRNGNMQ